VEPRELWFEPPIWEAPAFAATAMPSALRVFQILRPRAPQLLTPPHQGQAPGTLRQHPSLDKQTAAWPPTASPQAAAVFTPSRQVAVDRYALGD